MKRALVFLAITFGITYAYDFLVVYPIAEGIAAMCAWCTVLAIFLSYVTIRTGSTFAAALGHGAVNGTTNGVTLFSLTGGNPFVGPLCTGIVGGLPLLGHNILFDYSFIKQAAINARLDFEKEAWDTLKIARKALPDLESRSLEALCGYYQIPREHAHRAMDDVLETLALFRKLEEGFSEDHPEWFAAAPLKAKMKREVPATEAQKKYLADLIRYHELDLEPEWGALTKSRASRMIDQIILAHGRVEKRQRTEKK